jgi:hypothetical protein
LFRWDFDTAEEYGDYMGTNKRKSGGGAGGPSKKQRYTSEVDKEPIWFWVNTNVVDKTLLVLNIPICFVLDLSVLLFE